MEYSMMIECNTSSMQWLLNSCKIVHNASIIVTNNIAITVIIECIMISIVMFDILHGITEIIIDIIEGIMTAMVMFDILVGITVQAMFCLAFF